MIILLQKFSLDEVWAGGSWSLLFQGKGISAFERGKDAMCIGFDLTKE